MLSRLVCFLQTTSPSALARCPVARPAGRCGRRSPGPAGAAASPFLGRHEMIRVRRHSSRWVTDFLFRLMWREVPQREKGNWGACLKLRDPGSVSCGWWPVARARFRAPACHPPVAPPRPLVCLQTHAFIRSLVLCRIPTGLALGHWLGRLSGRQSPAVPVDTCHPVSQGPALVSSPGMALPQGVD